MLKAGNKKKEEEEEEEKKMVGGYSSTLTYYFKRCKNSVTDYVPDEVLYEILLRLPAQDIFSATLVCQKWYQMVRSSSKIFIRKHLEHSSYGLLYLNSSQEVVFTYARKVGGGIDTIKLNYSDRPRVSLWWSTCNGLILECDMRIYGTVKPYYVRNVLSHQLFRLPQSPYLAYMSVDCVIGYDATSIKYKVVLLFGENAPYICGILTVGVDKSWRILSVDNLSDLAKDQLRRGYPIVTEGFVHWIRISGKKIVTLNLETEIFAEHTAHGHWFLSSGRYLTSFSPCKKFVWKVFEMKSETGEWKKLPNIRLEGVEGKIKRLGINLKHDAAIKIKPLGWLKYPELLALRFQQVHIIFYDFTKCEICAETLPISTNDWKVTLHKNSLVRVDEF